jgi:hypothetical protein
MNDALPPLDFELSPFTGWTRDHWAHLLARLTYGYVLAAERQGTPARALFPGDRCDRPDSVDALEALARIAVPWSAWLHNPANPVALRFGGREMDLQALLRQALVEGTDPARPRAYWGDIGPKDQRIVEAANLAMAVWLSRARVFDCLSEAERARVIAWLAQVDGQETWPDNWILFPALSQAVRLHLGYPAPVADLDARLEQMAAFYRGDGWYADGAGDEYDLYNAWMFGCHYLLWAWIDGERRPDHRLLVVERARSFLAAFPHFFGVNGAYVAWGRSLTSRFGAAAAFQAGYRLGAAPGCPGGLRRLSSGCLRYFYEHGAIDAQAHYLRQGFHGDFAPAGESYVAPGSPLSATSGLLALCFDAADPFWNEPEAPLPVERGDFEIALTGPGFALSGRRATGQVLLLNSRSGHAPDVPRPDYTPKYGKFAYSTHFPFNVAPSAGAYASDGMISLTEASPLPTGPGPAFGHRDTTRAGGAAPGMIWCEFDEQAGGQTHRVRAAVLMWRDVQVRVAYLQPALPVRAVEAPGTLGCEGAAAVQRRSDIAAGWEYAEAEGRALAIRRLLGYDGQAASAPWLGYSNINLAYAYAEQPQVFESQASGAPRLVAAASLLRPQPFYPAAELAEFVVAPARSGAARVTLPDREMAWIALGDETPGLVEAAGVTAEGVGLRLLRVTPGAGRICGVGILSVTGVARLAAPGVLDLLRQPGGAIHVKTEAGVSLAEAWLGGGIRRAEVLTPGGEWADVSSQCRQTEIPAALVQEWAHRNQRRLIEFRLTT